MCAVKVQVVGRSLKGCPETGTHGVPIRPWVLDRLRECEGECRGVENPQIHCDAATNLLGVFMQRQAIPHGVRYPQARRGIRGLDLPIFLTPTQLAVRGQCATITQEEAPRRVRMTCNTRRRTVTKGTHLLRSALLALLALAVISGGSLAAGDLFDDDYKDCPHKTRLRDGQIADLSVNRDSDDEDHVNVAWSATDPATWGLGPNAYSTSLVVILDDGSSSTETLSLGSRKTTFEGVDTGVEVTVQMAIVVDTADGKYLISDILEQSINQSLTEPSFSTGWHRVASTSDADDDASADTTADLRNGFQIDTEAVDAGMMYYIGYNENFANYKAASGLVTTPTTPRLRIGLAHSANETDGERDDVDFEAYIIRIMDEDGDEVGNDASTFASSYGTVTHARTGVTVGTETLDISDTYDKQLVVYGTDPVAIVFGDDGTATATGKGLSNVRIVDGDEITVAMHDSTSGLTRAAGIPNPNGVPLSLVRVGSLTGDETDQTDIATPTEGTVYAAPPDEHRDFSLATFDSDTRYTIQAWAVNEDDEVISPIATLEIRPIDTAHGDVADFQDYKLGAAVAVTSLVTTQFTVEK